MAITSGAPKRGMRDYVLNLDSVNEQHVDTDGDFFHIQQVSVGGANVFLRFDDGPQITRQQGEGNRVYYERVSLTSSVACQVTVQLGYGYATDSRASVSATVNTTLAPAAVNVPLADVVCNAGVATQLAPATAKQLELAIGLASTAAGALRLGDVTVAAAQGEIIEPGDKLGWGTSAAVYAFNPNGVAVTVTLTSLRSP